jgi:hypothetical protein
MFNTNHGKGPKTQPQIGGRREKMGEFVYGWMRGKGHRPLLLCSMTTARHGLEGAGICNLHVQWTFWPQQSPVPYSSSIVNMRGMCIAFLVCVMINYVTHY